MTGVVLIGKAAVMERFETFDTDTWALYQGKQFIVGGKGAGSLDGWLTGFDQAGTTATYMLRVYDGDEIPTSGTGSIDYIACIPFKIVDQYQGQGIAGHNIGLMKRIGDLEEQLKGKDEPGEDLSSVLMGWLEDPVKLNQVAGAFRTIFGGSSPVPTIAGPVQAISGVNAPAEDPVTRLAAAIDKLEKKDPKLVEHIEKLAKLAESDPVTFQFVIGKLDAL